MSMTTLEKDGKHDLLHPTDCDLCDTVFMSDGYDWLCGDCHSKPKDCLCGSDDVLIDWHVSLDSANPFYLVECQTCESQTSRTETAYCALEEWNSLVDCPMCGKQTRVGDFSIWMAIRSILGLNYTGDWAGLVVAFHWATIIAFWATIIALLIVFGIGVSVGKSF